MCYHYSAHLSVRKDYHKRCCYNTLEGVNTSIMAVDVFLVSGENCATSTNNSELFNKQVGALRNFGVGSPDRHILNIPHHEQRNRRHAAALGGAVACYNLYPIDYLPSHWKLPLEKPGEMTAMLIGLTSFAAYQAEVERSHTEQIISVVPKPVYVEFERHFPDGQAYEQLNQGNGAGIVSYNIHAIEG